MAKEAGRPKAELLTALLAEGKHTSFFEVVHFVEQLWPEAARVGEQGPADAERIRLRPSASLSFPARDIEAVSLSEDQERVELTTTFFGLFGADSPLPTAYADHMAAISTEPAGERVCDFLNIFHHRLLSLLHRAWSKYRVSQGPESDRLFQRLLSLVGFSRQLHQRCPASATPADARVQVMRGRTAAGLEALLRRRLGDGVSVEQMQRRVVKVPESQRSRLGRRSCGLGTTMLLGRQITDRSRLRIAVKVDAYGRFLDLAPGGAEHEVICDAVESYLRTPIDREIALELPSEAILPWALGGPQQLGRSAWIGHPPEPSVTVRFDRDRPREPDSLGASLPAADRPGA